MIPRAAAARPLPTDPYDAVRLENDVLGVRLWGPAGRPTLSVGKADIWDRRWFGDRQPLVTLARLKELAAADRLGELGRYDVYNQYDFPCPKPGGQVIVGVPFATNTTVQPGEQGEQVLIAEGPGANRLQATIWVALGQPLIVIECETERLAPDDVWLRIWRHRDTIRPGEPVDPTLGDGKSATDFEQLPPPRCRRAGEGWGIRQSFGAEPTFPQGFDVVLAALTDGPVRLEEAEGQRGLGTRLWAEQEGRLSHGVIKRYAPLNESPGAAITARFRVAPPSFTVYATVATTQDGPDPGQVARRTLESAKAAGPARLRQQQVAARAQAQRQQPAAARVAGSVVAAAAPAVLPRLRKAGGYYGDVALCSVDSTKFCFQDAAIWHADFHLNEVRAEHHLALGQFPEVLPYCEMIHRLLPSAEENAREVYHLPGAMYPLVHFPLRCHGVAHTNATWEQDMGLNGLVSKPLWLYYRYTGDRAFLRDLAYPVLRAGARFCRAYLAEEADGRLHIVPTVSPEHWGLTARFERNRDCLSALTLTRYLLRAAAAAAETLGADPAEAEQWRQAAGRLADFPTYDTPAGPVWVDVAGAPPIEYNIPVPLAAVFWGDEVGLDSPPELQALARRTLDQINVWVPHRGYLNGAVRPRLGLWQDDMSVGVENLLLSYQSIRLFPAVPPGQEVAFEHLWAEGGFRVSARRTAAGMAEEVRIESTLGGECRVASPWPGRPVEVTSAGKQVLHSPAANSHIVFPTERGEAYSLRQVG